MPKLSNLKYHCAREVFEREAALSATCPEVSEKHFVLAEMHADRAWSIMEGYTPNRRAGRSPVKH